MLITNYRLDLSHNNLKEVDGSLGSFNKLKVNMLTYFVLLLIDEMMILGAEPCEQSSEGQQTQENV